MSRAARIINFLLFLFFEITTWAVALVAISLEFWLDPKNYALPFIANAGLWKVCYSESPEGKTIDSAGDFFGSIGTGFSGLADTKFGCTTRTGTFYSNVYGNNHIASLNIVRGCAIGFIYGNILKTCAVLMHFFSRYRNQSTINFARFMSIFMVLIGWTATFVYLGIIVSINNDAPDYASSSYTDTAGWCWWFFLAGTIWSIFATIFLWLITLKDIEQGGVETLRKDYKDPEKLEPLMENGKGVHTNGNGVQHTNGVDGV